MSVEKDRDTFFIIGDSYLNISTVQWYRDRLDLVTADPEDPIDLFRELLPDNTKVASDKIKWRKCRYYKELPIPIMWKLFNDLFVLFSGLITKPIRDQVTVEEIETETNAVLRTMLWWTLKNPVQDIEHIDSVFLTADNTAFNNKFRVFVRYMSDLISNMIRRMKLLSALPERTSLPNNNELEIDMFKRIRESCSGDIEEYIFYIRDEIQNRIIQREHRILAKLRLFDYSGDPRTLENDIRVEECFRILFPTFFDDHSIFDSFIKEHKFDCFLFYNRDYLHRSDYIQYIPLLHKYSDGNTVSEQLLQFLVA